MWTIMWANQWVFTLASILYIIVFFGLIIRLVKQTAINQSMYLTLCFLGVALHGYLLFPQVFTDNGLNFGIFNVVSLISLFLMLFFLGFCMFRSIISLGVLAAPTAYLGLIASQYGKSYYQPIQNISLGLESHILLSIAAYSLLLMAAVQAFILRLQIRELKHDTIHRVWVSSLPSLQTMEKLLVDMLVLGFVLLTVALLLGFVYVDDFFAQHIAHKTIFSLVSWLVFAYLIFGHWKFGWRGKRASMFTIYGFCLLAIGFVGSKVVLELIIHSN